MASQKDHLAQADRNEQTMNFLMQDKESHGGWIATVAFYSALHYIEAALLLFSDDIHNHDHGSRFELIKKLANVNKELELIYKRYRILFTASCIARYLEYNAGTKGRPDYRGYPSFRDCSFANVEEDLLVKCFKPVKDTVQKMLTRQKKK